MKMGEYGFYEGYEPRWMSQKDGNKGLSAADRKEQNKMALAAGIAAEIRSRHAEMQVRRIKG